MRRLLLVMMCASGYLLTASGSAAQTGDAWIGTWTLNVAQSSFDPANLAPKSQTTKMTAAGGTFVLKCRPRREILCTLVAYGLLPARHAPGAQWSRSPCRPSSGIARPSPIHRRGPRRRDVLRAAVALCVQLFSRRRRDRQ